MLTDGCILPPRQRSLKLWFVLRSFGVSGFQNHLRKACGLIDKLAEIVSADLNFSFPAPPSFALLTFRLTPPSQPQESYDAINRKLYDRINNRKDVLLTQTILPEVGFSIRLALGTPSTQWEHVEQVWQAVKEEADAVLAELK
jgi:aromatic-L-amino-acid decarboxylase